MGGEIWVESELNKGSTFHVVLEMGRQPEANEQKLEFPAEIQGITALVVDDNQSSRMIMSEMLEAFNFQVTVAPSGDEALERLDRRFAAGDNVDLVLMDWRMPGRDGISTSREIKKDPRMRETKIIMMTAFGREEEMQHALAVGVEAFLLKPIKQSMLFDTIMEVFGHKPLLGAKRVRERGVIEGINKKSLAGSRVLLVEDNAINQQVALEMLSGAGLTIDIAVNGKEAVEAVARERYDAVLMDVQMPEMDGLEATRVIRGDRRHAGLPIIAMTAHSMKGDLERCLEAGMNDYISKPVDRAKLFSTLIKWMQKRGSTAFAPLSGQAPAPAGAPDGEVPPSDLPGLDLDTGLQRMNGSWSLYRRVLAEFARDHARVCDEVRDALGKGDRELAERLTHTLKGLCGTIAATSLTEAAEDLDAATRRGEPDLEPRLGRLEQCLVPVLNGIRSLEVQAGSAAEDDAEDGESLETLLAELSLLLRDSNLEAEDCMKRVRRRLGGSDLDRTLRQLELELGRFDFGAAHATLEELAASLDVVLE